MLSQNSNCSYVVLRINKIEFPAVEHVTVISGTFQIGMGDQFDESKLNPMIAGTFGFLDLKMNHFAMAKRDTVIQLHGIGPWQIKYVNPVDDPRKNYSVALGLSSANWRFITDC